MPVIPYTPIDIQDPRELVASIRSRRGGALLNLDRMLLHSPAFATGWNGFLGTVRNDLNLPPKLRELAICIVAILNRAEYELIQHSPEFLKAGGTRAQLDALQRISSSTRQSSLFDTTELAVIQLSIEMTQSVQVSEATMHTVKAELKSDQNLVELIGVIATYNMVSRYLVALGIEPE
ncbi:Alkylhydroperoxidase family enzyme, contains CxxC motif [Desulfuromusa kysingii]|uniref:Alkylhydroperoxidase family enzyme, contains CxxC motif n=1 Tax=Desulfuromusa kysingii TaxID=37625 RepID=A0A1H4BZE1_9BACT|nr:carboxymuconolactone decarboxylase family protein [Desulfuromusa kysingii]SEA53565.1 Alkylhydroperoxidase family enzyme, contains CxxC motif [Desulfuromusa kysingii]